jgi:hypothetical protein
MSAEEKVCTGDLLYIKLIHVVQGTIPPPPEKLLA